MALRSAVKMSVTRREAIATAFTAAITLIPSAFPSAANAEGGPYTLPPLPYPYNALEPYIDETTMKFHHDKHHQAYVTNVNKALEGKPAVSLVDLQKGAIKAGPAIRNNGGGHYNHALFWKTMTPADKSGAPSPALAKAIDASFGGVDKLGEAFAAAAATRFGSGWAWLGVAPDGKLVIDSTPNQDNPLMEGAGCKAMIPILGLDVWEHAYYLKYQNRRPDYIKAFMSVVNWAEVSSNYEQYAAKGLPVPV
jgi:superoxide dismutase, Fe-Mn family